MAWISVHEQVTSGKLRRLAKELRCSQNEVLGMLVKFWLWGISNADRYGYIEGTDKEDIADVVNIGISKNIDPEEADIRIIQITQNYLDEAINSVESHIKRVLEVKNEESLPDRCELCDCCRHNRILTHPISIEDLVAGI